MTRRLFRWPRWFPTLPFNPRAQITGWRLVALAAGMARINGSA